MVMALARRLSSGVIRLQGGVRKRRLKWANHKLPTLNPHGTHNIKIKVGNNNEGRKTKGNKIETEKSPRKLGTDTEKTSEQLAQSTKRPGEGLARAQAARSPKKFGTA